MVVGREEIFCCRTRNKRHVGFHLLCGDFLSRLKGVQWVIGNDFIGF